MNTDTKIWETPAIETAEPERDVKPKLPPMWEIILLNDDITPPHYVQQVNMEVFSLTREGAWSAMFVAHSTGRCTMLITTQEEAASYLQEIRQMNDRNDQPHLRYIMKKKEKDTS